MDLNNLKREYYVMKGLRPYYMKLPLKFSVHGVGRVLLGMIPAGSRVLDYGCDDGSLGGLGDYAGLHIDGLDFSTYNRKAKYHSLDEVDGVYDYVICLHMFEHNYPVEVSEMLTKVRPHARNLVISGPSTNYMFNQFTGDLTHVWDCSTFDFAYYMERHGYKVDNRLWTNIGPRSTLYDVFSTFNRTVFSLMVRKLPFQEFGWLAHTVPEIPSPEELLKIANR